MPNVDKFKVQLGTNSFFVKPRKATLYLAYVYIPTWVFTSNESAND